MTDVLVSHKNNIGEGLYMRAEPDRHVGLYPGIRMMKDRYGQVARTQRPNRSIYDAHRNRELSLLFVELRQKGGVVEAKLNSMWPKLDSLRATHLRLGLRTQWVEETLEVKILFLARQEM